MGLEPHDLRVMSPTSYQLLYPAIFIARVKCRTPGLNRYVTFVTRDFKSRASANSASPASTPAAYSNPVGFISSLAALLLYHSPQVLSIVFSKKFQKIFRVFPTSSAHAGHSTTVRSKPQNPHLYLYFSAKKCYNNIKSHKQE